LSQPSLRLARDADVAAIVAMLADDDLGATREGAPSEGLDPAYLAAFAAITASPSNQLWVLEEQDGEVIGTYQLTFTPGLSFRGGTRATIEAVRVRRDRRDRGHGGVMMRHAIEVARARGCVLVQLTSNAARVAAHRFYERLGFVRSHVGMKIELP
jgi:GNAT superfamily N-acetyltransferase